MRKPLIGKLYSFAFPKRNDAIQGIVLDHKQEWMLLRRVFDYNVDGFTHFYNKEVDERRAEYEKFAERILPLKYHSLQKVPKTPTISLHEMLTFIDRKYRLIQLDMPDGKAFDAVSYLDIDSDLYVFDELTARAKWRYRLKLREVDFRYINFDNDYLNSLRLVTRFKKTVKV